MATLAPSGGPKLSEVASHLVMPDGIVSSDFPLLAPQIERMGTPLDRWQQGLCTAILAKRENGMYACGIGGAITSIPRQVGKTYTIGVLIFALCAMNPGTLVLWSAHRARTHQETFKSMDSMSEKPGVKPYVKRVLTGAGTEAVEFANESRILFGARENGFGRGFPGVDVVVLDEAQILTEKAMEDMVPATNASPNGLVLMMGTPPRPGDPGEVFTSRRESALSGDDTDALYVEFSADRNARPDDREQWKKANPSFPHRTSETAILRMKKLLGSPESFLREGLGIWDERAVGQKAVQSAAWDSLVVGPDGVSDGRRVIGIRFTPDGSTVAVAGAVKPDDESLPFFVEPIEQRSTAEGTQWLVDFLVERHEDLAQIVIDGKSGVGYLVNALRAEGVSVKTILTPSVGDATAAYSMMDAAIKNGSVLHSGVQDLDDQVKTALRRKIGNDGGFGWESADGGSVALFEAVTLAHWGARVTKRRPGRRAMFV